MTLFEEDDKNRLFETHQATRSSFGNYLKLILLVALTVTIVVGIIVYFSLPGVSDEVKAPKGLEDEIRLHFLDKEKRTVTDTSYFLCDKFYWVRVGVESRPDIPGKPNNLVSRYIAKASQSEEGTWTIAATPITSGENDVPCSF